MTTSPFAQTATATTPTLTFDDPNEIPTDYVRIEDVDGRTICVFPHEVRHEPKGSSGPYDYVMADVIVLDGPIFGKIERLPMLVKDMRINADRVVKAIKPNVGTGRAIMGKIDSQRSKSGGKAYDMKPVGQSVKEHFTPAVQQALAQGIDG